MIKPIIFGCLLVLASCNSSDRMNERSVNNNAPADSTNKSVKNVRKAVDSTKKVIKTFIEPKPGF